MTLLPRGDDRPYPPAPPAAGRSGRVLGALAVADFRERSRRPAYVVTLAAAIALGYLALPPASSVWVVMNAGGYRGVYDSAYAGTVTALAGGLWLMIGGFYVVRGAITRDEQSGVGQVLGGHSTAQRRLPGGQVPQQPHGPGLHGRRAGRDRAGPPARPRRVRRRPPRRAAAAVRAADPARAGGDRGRRGAVRDRPGAARRAGQRGLVLLLDVRDHRGRRRPAGRAGHRGRVHAPGHGRPAPAVRRRVQPGLHQAGPPAAHVQLGRAASLGRIRGGPARADPGRDRAGGRARRSGSAGSTRPGRAGGTRAAGLAALRRWWWRRLVRPR